LTPLVRFFEVRVSPGLVLDLLFSLVYKNAALERNTRVRTHTPFAVRPRLAHCKEMRSALVVGAEKKRVELRGVCRLRNVMLRPT